jgi:hypothetical protein
MAIKTWNQIALDHIKNLVIRMGNCYAVIYFEDKSTITIDPNNQIKELGYLDNDESNKIDISNDDEEPEDDESEDDDEYELDPDDEEDEV